ncbi:MAG: hypothetical protein OEQ47_02890 [Acidimicrobiia bacterium]|nr:hypothetical protein [Acidimicrobiia bacterium]
MRYEEKPTSKRARIAWLIVAWVLFLGPFTAVVFFLAGWWGFIGLAIALWFTYDYLKRGDMFSPVDAMVSGEGRLFGNFWEHEEERNRH